MKFLKLAAVLLAMLSLTIVGCKKGSQDTVSTESSNLKISMVTDTGGVNDQSFNQSAWEGMQRSNKELGIGVSYLESKQDADYGPNMAKLLDAGTDIIWGIGFLMGDAVLAEAKSNPSQKYAIIDMAYETTPSNLCGVVFKAEEASFLVGYIAGKMSKSGKVGFIGGKDFPVIHGFQYGFMAGVKQANPSVEVLVQYADSFNDTAKGKAIAKQMYQNGADIIFHAAGAVGDGVIESAKEQKKYAIGVDRDQNYLAPDYVITSAMKRVDNAIFNISKDLKDGKFPGGTTVSYGLKEGGVDIAPTSDKHVPADILKEVANLKQNIIDGKISVPANKKSFETFSVK